MRAALTVRATARSGRCAVRPVARVDAAEPKTMDTESPELVRLRNISFVAWRRTLEWSGSASMRSQLGPSPAEHAWLGAPRGGLDQQSEDTFPKLRLPDLRLSVTRQALRYVQLFSGTDRGRRMYATWLKRSGRYQELIRAEFRDWRLPEDLLWVVMVESGFDPRATSPAGAVGLWQFMPSTGDVYGLTRNSMLDERRNPTHATRAAAHHLRDLFLRFGNWDLALAAYNMGYGQLADAMGKHGTSDFAELARRGAIPDETAAYVPKIAACAIIANNLERFGFETVELAPPIEAGEVAVLAGTSLRVVAQAAGVGTSLIRALNPDILGDHVPQGHGDYLVMVPIGSVSQARAALPVMMVTDAAVLGEPATQGPGNVVVGGNLLRRHWRQDEQVPVGARLDPRHRATLAGWRGLERDGDRMVEIAHPRWASDVNGS